VKYFQDITKHKYFNTNNLWINLPALKEILASKKNIMGLPLIRNSKTVDPKNKKSTPVYQLETAMGAAIGVIEGSRALRVPRNRFLPVKTTGDLLPIRSDAYELTEDFRVILHPDRKGKYVKTDLDTDYYKFINQLEARFPAGSPSLIECEAMTVVGDVKFGKNITLKGKVKILNNSGKQVEIKDDEVIEGEISFN